MPPCSSPLLPLCPFLITEIPITANGLSEQKLQRFSHPPPPISPRPENNPKMHIKKSDTGSYLHTSLAMIDFSDDTHLAGTAFIALIFFFHCKRNFTGFSQVQLYCCHTYQYFLFHLLLKMIFHFQSLSPTLRFRGGSFHFHGGI